MTRRVLNKKCLRCVCVTTDIEQFREKMDKFVIYSCLHSICVHLFFQWYFLRNLCIFNFNWQTFVLSPIHASDYMRGDIHFTFTMNSLLDVVVVSPVSFILLVFLNNEMMLNEFKTWTKWWWRWNDAVIEIVEWVSKVIQISKKNYRHEACFPNQS